MCVVDINSRVCCLAPRRDNTRGSWCQQHICTYPWLIPIITWCWPFPFVSTNILLIKSKWKLESRAIAVGVAMSPRNLGGKYRCRPHPRGSRKFTRQFFAGSRACKSNCTRAASSLDDRHNIVDHEACLKLNFCGTLSFPTKTASSTHMVYIRTWTGRYVF